MGDYRMLRRLAIYQTLIAVSVCAAIAAWGCAANHASGVRAGENRGELSPGVDPARAHLPLSRIEPLPSKPVRPESLKPLSDRGSKQVAAARKLADEQRYTEAVIELERALRYDPDHPDVHRALAVLHWEAGNPERARAHVTRALETNPDDAAAQYIAGRCHAAVGDTSPALTAYRTSLLCSDAGRDPHTEALCRYHLAEALAAQGYLEAALEQYSAFEGKAAGLPQEKPGGQEALSVLQPNTRGAAEARSSILEKLGRFNEAATALAPLASASPHDAALGLRYARLLARAGRLDEALTAVRAIPSDEQEVIELLSEIHRRAGHPEGIVADLRLRIAARPDEPRLVLELSDRLVLFGSGGEARRELQQYLENHPGADAVRARLADLYIAQSAWNDALQVCAAGVEQSPQGASEFEEKIAALASNPQAPAVLLKPPARKESSAALYLRGVLAAAAGKDEQAEEFLRRSHTQQARFIPSRVALGRVYLRMCRYDDALHVAGRVQEDEPEDPCLELLLGEVRERLDDATNAELHFKAASQLDRSDPRPMLGLARLYKGSGKGLQAQRLLTVLLEKDPDHEAARELLAFTYLEEGKRDVAVAQFEELVQRATTPLMKARTAALLDLMRSPDPNLETYRKTLLDAIGQHGADAATWLAMAESYDADLEPEKKLEAYRSALAIGPDDEEAAVGMVRTSQRLLAFEEAIEQLKSLLRRRPNRHSWRFGAFEGRRGLIELYWIVQDYESALAVARGEAQRDDLDERWRRQYRMALVETLRQAGNRDEALAHLDQWAGADSDDEFWSIRLAEEYINQNQASRAVPILESAYNSDATGIGKLARLVQALSAAGQTDRASQYILEWLDNDPESEHALMMLAEVLAKGDRLEDAIELVRNRLLHTEHREDLQEFLIRRLLTAKRYDACAQLLEAHIDEILQLLEDADRREHPENLSDEQRIRLPDEPFTPMGLIERLTSLHLAFAQTLIAAKRYREAQDRLSAWLEGSRDPKVRFALLRLLGACHQLQGDEQQAGETLERALLLRPDDLGTNNDVAYGWIDRGTRIDEAARMIRQALSQEPQQGAYLDTYGWLLYKKGEFGEAKKWLLRADHARGAVDPVVRDHLGDTCWRLGEREQAVEHWTAAATAVRDKPEDELSSEDERRVRSGTWQKIEDAGAGRTPAIASLASDK
jgi:tetratricopeptide (TPR) repeat protein